jgi:hypothetical protein
MVVVIESYCQEYNIKHALVKIWNSEHEHMCSYNSYHGTFDVSRFTLLWKATHGSK